MHYRERANLGVTIVTIVMGLDVYRSLMNMYIIEASQSKDDRTNVNAATNGKQTRFRAINNFSILLVSLAGTSDKIKVLASKVIDK